MTEATTGNISTHPDIASQKNAASVEAAAVADALSMLRTETALSRFPMHRLTKGQVKIEFRNQLSAVHWKVTHDSDYGAPGPLAYKVESLFINRKIEESGRPVPKIIRLGSLREIMGEVDLGHNTAALKTALLQNATSNITAKISYRTKEGGEQWLEAVFNRYSLVFTGESLPGGGRADAVHLVLNDIYQQVLNTAVFRPLDYDYMKTLPPISQRFYEIASYQVFGALKRGNPRAKLLYSEYCLLSTATRYGDFDHVKKQMYKILRPHVRSGYLAKVEYQAQVNEAGEADWMMMLTPGPAARREYRAFTGQGQTRKAKSSPKALGETMALETMALPFEASDETALTPALPKKGAASSAPVIGTAAPAKPTKQATSAPSVSLSTSEAKNDGQNAEPPARVQELIAALTLADLNRGDAERFAAQCPEVCLRQLEYLPFVDKFKTSRGAYLRRAIEGDFGPPAAYLQAQERETVQKSAKAKRAQELFEANQEKARQHHEERFGAAYFAWLKERAGDLQQSHPGAFAAFLASEGEQRAVYFKPPFAGRPMNERALEIFDRQESHLERFVAFFRSKGAPLPTFWEWDEGMNPEAFQP